VPDPVEPPDQAVDTPHAPSTAAAPPPPPPVPPPPDAPTVVDGVRLNPRSPRPGELSVGWRAVTAATWIGVIIGLAAVWNASVQIGLSTWWLGARADPQPRYIQFAPFVPPVLVLLATVYQMRWIPWIGLGASAIIAAIGVADIGRVTSLAAVELVIAGAAAAVSIASFSGVYRRVDDGSAAVAGSGAATDTATS